MNRIVKAAVERDKIRKQGPALADLIGRMSKAKAEGRNPWDEKPATASSIPPHLRPTVPEPRLSKKAKSQPENKVVQACFQVLKAHGIFAWRNNTGCAWIGNRPIRYGLPGSADILGLLPNGRFLAVECKSAKGTQSNVQKTFEENITRNNGIYVLVRDASKLEEVLRDCLR